MELPQRRPTQRILTRATQQNKERIINEVRGNGYPLRFNGRRIATVKEQWAFDNVALETGRQHIAPNFAQTGQWVGKEELIGLVQ